MPHHFCRYALLVVLLLTACGRGDSSSDLPPRSADRYPSQPEPVVASAPAEDPAQAAALAQYSGGLGLTRAAFEIHHGKIVPCGGGSPFSCVEGKEGIYIKRLSTNGRIIGMGLSGKGAKTIGEARTLAGRFLPKDRKLIKFYALGLPEGEEPVILFDNPIDGYHSDWLAQQLTKQEWSLIGKPGDFQVLSSPSAIDIDLGEYR